MLAFIELHIHRKHMPCVTYRVLYEFHKLLIVDSLGKINIRLLAVSVTFLAFVVVFCCCFKSQYVCLLQIEISL